MLNQHVSIELLFIIVNVMLALNGMDMIVFVSIFAYKAPEAITVFSRKKNKN